MAFILVQHLDPTHESMMVDLLATHTPMTVLQATEGMPVEPDHLYIIPPGAYPSISRNTLHLSPPRLDAVLGCPWISCCSQWQPATASGLFASSYREPGPMAALA
jgi:hypothetical protein